MGARSASFQSPGWPGLALALAGSSCVGTAKGGVACCGAKLQADSASTAGLASSIGQAPPACTLTWWRTLATALAARPQLDPGVADLLDELNSRIDDPDFKIGPSYFMRNAVHEPDGLERAWRTAILPLLEEHHYGDGTDVRARYGLDPIRARVAGRAASQQVGSSGGEPADPA